jgi:hypothetical protein
MKKRTEKQTLMNSSECGVREKRKIVLPFEKNNSLFSNLVLSNVELLKNDDKKEINVL